MSAYFVDSLRNEFQEDEFYRPYANSQDGKGAVINFAWMTEVPDWVSTKYGNPDDSFEPLDAAGRAVVLDAMAQFSAVADIRWVKTSQDEANTFIGSWFIPKDVGAAAYATYAGFDLTRGTIAHPTEVMFSTYYGVHAPYALHELGHTLGLKHPHDGSSVLPEDEQLHANTVMAYASDWISKLGLFDVIALQSIYGPARRRLGDDTYVFGKDKLIWDGGGHDRIDASTATQGITLLLDDGSWSHAGARSTSFLDPSQVWIGDFTWIEDARGSSFDDVIKGNKSANHIVGEAGQDRLTGALGRDDLQGGSGSDRLEGGAGADILRGGDGQDRLVGGAGADRLWGGKGADLFVFQTKGAAGAGAARDVVEMFDTRDHIDLSALDLAYLGRGAFTGAGHELRATPFSGGTLLMVDFDGNATAEFQVWLRDVTALSQDQLIL